MRIYSAIESLVSIHFCGRDEDEILVNEIDM